MKPRAARPNKIVVAVVENMLFCCRCVKLVFVVNRSSSSRRESSVQVRKVGIR